MLHAHIRGDIMTIRTLILTVFIAALAQPALATTCDDLSRQAEKNGGVWPEAKPLPSRGAALDGPWYSPGAREQDNPLPGFPPQALPDRARLLAEAKGDNVATAYLASSAKAFDVAITPVDSEVDGAAVAVKVHRFAGTNVFAVAAHDEVWYDCQRQIALFYTGTDGKLHYASGGNITDCTSRGDTEQGANTALIGGRFAYVDEKPDLSSVTSQVGLHQTIYLWQGDHLAGGCSLAYRYRIGYVYTDETEYSDDTFRDRPANAWDAWMKQSFQPWMAEYGKIVVADDTRAALPTDKWQKAHYEDEMTRFHVAAVSNPAYFPQLKSAYDALVADHRINVGGVALPVERDGQAYLVSAKQHYGPQSAVYPDVELVLYSADGKPPRRMGNILVERQPEKVLSVTVEAKR